MISSLNLCLVDDNTNLAVAVPEFAPPANQHILGQARFNAATGILN